ncbi:hypothetical protein ABID58_005986 [Bradyrhizobium sp. S3.2.6]|uniref:hypothetical protein n=1 Tax=Bradyrhizobium sp. S3.2.6 TaxID=3156428 RepID=UPI003397627C
MNGGIDGIATLISVNELPQINESSSNRAISEARVACSDVACSACVLMRCAPGFAGSMIRKRRRGLAEFGPHRPIESDFSYSASRIETNVAA